jgi:hypothetical protein
MAKRRISFKGGVSTTVPSGESYSPAVYTPTTYTVTTVVSTNVYEPEFNFYIPNSEFYINTPAVSVADVSKSATNFNDGVFYFMNKNNTPIYYNTIDITAPTITTDIVATNNQTRRNSVFNPVAKIRASFIDSANKVVSVNKDVENITTDEVYTYVPYTVLYRGNRLGQIVLRILSIYYNNSGIVVYPFESVPFAAAYVSENVGQLAKLYYGKTIKSLNKNVGTIDFIFNFQYYTENPLVPETNPSIKYQPIVISINTVNTGYVPSAISLSLTRPPTGGFTPAPATYLVATASPGVSV